MSRKNKVLISIVFSVLLHFLFFGMAAVVSVYLPPQPAQQPQQVATPFTQEPIQVDLLGNNGMQIADISPPEKEEKPDKANFAGLYDSKVKEEMVSPTRRPAGQKGAHQKSEKSEEKGSEKEESKERSPETPKETAKEPSPTQMTYHEDSEEKEKIAKAPQKKTKKSDPSEESSSNKKEIPGEEEDYFENGLSEDYFPNYRVGQHTYLNVFKYPKIAYYVRLKKVFRTTFNPGSALRGVMSNQISKGQISVVLGVTVDRSGRLSDLMVIRSSGIDRYDSEALRTIKDSAPFSAPPDNLMGSDNVLRMAWTFVVYL